MRLVNADHILEICEQIWLKESRVTTQENNSHPFQMKNLEFYNQFPEKNH